MERQEPGNLGYKIVLDVDLNFPAPPEENSASIDSWVVQNAAVAINSIPTLAESNKGLACSPIDVEAIDDDVELLHSSAMFPQGRNLSSRRRPIVDLEAIEEISPALSGLIETETVVTLLSFNNSNDAEWSRNRTGINHPQYFDLEGDDGAMWQRSNYCEDQTTLSLLPPLPPPQPEPSEPTFRCAVCMSSLTDPCSTVCGHIFCQLCIEAAIKAKKQCPICRRKLPSKKSFHRVYLPTTN